MDVGKSKTEQGVCGGFPATHWSLVDAAVGRGPAPREEALEKLCGDYWYPLYAFARRSGSSASDAEDLTQGFFLKLLENDSLSDVDREKGKLRTFLLTAFRRYQANEWRRGNAIRRGAGKVITISELEGLEKRYANARPELTAEELFDRQWALALLGKVLADLELDFSESGKAREYEVLKGVLTADRGELDYVRLAKSLETSEGAARVAAHRLRKKFRQRFRLEITQTLEEGADLSEELSYLAKVLAG